jgi:MoaA/NifB/PqqE/SkfB family radical SAM enzyme
MHRKRVEQVELDDARHILNFLAQNRFLIVYLTGGEPTLHPDIEEIVSYSSQLGLVTTMTTNGTVSRAKIKQLKDAGLYLMSVSIDHWDPRICEKIRNHADIQDKQIAAINCLKELGLRTYALAYLNPKLVEDGVEKLVTFVNDELGVPLGFCYPTYCDSNTYQLGGEEVSHNLLVLRSAVQKLLDMKRNGSRIANLYCYMEDVVGFPSQEPNFYCRGGEDVVYVDWFGDVYPCFRKSQRMFNILRDRELNFLSGIRCNECLINCFREPSLLPQISSSVGLLVKEVLYSFSNRSIYR